jgi:hypothetical protein
MAFCWKNFMLNILIKVHGVHNNMKSENWSSDDCGNEDGFFYGCTEISEWSVASTYMVDLTIVRYGEVQ